MKNIYSRKTNRLVLNLLNGLGIIACLSVSSCGIKEKNPKGMETDNELGWVEEELKKANCNFFNLNLDYQEKIVRWFKYNSHQTNFTLSRDILNQIFCNYYVVNSIEQTLEGDISNPNGDESKKKELRINKEGRRGKKRIIKTWNPREEKDKSEEEKILISKEIEKYRSEEAKKKLEEAKKEEEEKKEEEKKREEEEFIKLKKRKDELETEIIELIEEKKKLKGAEDLFLLEIKIKELEEKDIIKLEEEIKMFEEGLKILEEGKIKMFEEEIKISEEKRKEFFKKKREFEEKKRELIEQKIKISEKIEEKEIRILEKNKEKNLVEAEITKLEKEIEELPEAKKLEIERLKNEKEERIDWEKCDNIENLREMLVKVRNSKKRIKILVENNKVLFDNVALPIDVCNLDFWDTLNGFLGCFI